MGKQQYMYLIPGKKSASWQLVALITGQKRRKAAKHDVKLPNQPKLKGKIGLNGKCIFFVIIFPGMMFIL